MEIKIPFLGDGIESANVISVLIAPGDKVEIDDTLAEMETDKATAPIPATAAGIVESVKLKEGDVIRQGMLVCTLKGGDSAAAPANTPIATPVAQPTQAHQPITPIATQNPSGSVAPYQFPQVDLATIATSPSIRKISAQIGLDLTRISGTGNGGRITMDDVKNHLATIQSLAFNPPAAPAAQGGVPAKPKKPLPDFSKYGDIKVEKLSSLRMKIADVMTNSWTTIPHVTQFDEADITDLMALRKKYNPKYMEKKGRITVTVFILKAIVEALKEYPTFNSTFDDEKGELIYKNHYHFGVAVDTENGLMVPVIKNVDKKSMLELATELEEIAGRARDRKITLDDVQGGTFTISNLGSLGVGPFTPIVNHPEVAIIGLGIGKKRPEFVDGKLVERIKMPISISYDHRVIDGADGARFTRKIIEGIELFDEKLLKAGLK
ncbi:MAG: 2-oxo acid dehydrogenase subunit E2 [bacterium]|nr:2-oxo acid dehydrogenase subunit E2 [bacterium]